MKRVRIVSMGNISTWFRWKLLERRQLNRTTEMQRWKFDIITVDIHLFVEAKLLSILSTLQVNQKLDRHRRGLWLIHGIKHYKDIQLKSVTHPCRMSYLIIYKYFYSPSIRYCPKISGKNVSKNTSTHVSLEEIYLLCLMHLCRIGYNW